MIDFTNIFRRKPALAMGSPKANDQVRVKLAYYGDEGADPRHVIHYAYPLIGADLSLRPEMIEALRGRGFVVRDATAHDGLALEHHSAVASEDFDLLTAELSGWFAAREWDYDGWECAVVAPVKKQAC
ncbi:MAG: hypothetical protein ACE5FO_08860 [Parvularculaceae bacterium]